jgi:hypothetical protein
LFDFFCLFYFVRECSFVTKAINAEQAGAVGVVITDNDVNNDHAFIDMIDDNTDRTVGIPATFLLGKDGYVWDICSLQSKNLEPVSQATSYSGSVFLPYKIFTDQKKC